MVGDPHFISFDGTRYTFNGHGEFTLLRTHSNQFVIQGRMEPFLKDFNGSVLTSVAVRLQQDRLNIVTNQLDSNMSRIDVYLNDTQITADYLPKMYFRNFAISYNTSSQLSILFSNGVQLECQSTNNYITKFMVALPSSLKEMVSGLMGTYDNDTSNDLSPLNSSGSLGVALNDPSLKDLHVNFGLSCKYWVSICRSNITITILSHGGA